jgi:hypothetical protein
MLTIEKPYYVDRRFVPLKSFFGHWDYMSDWFDARPKIIFRKNYHGSKSWNEQKQEQYIDNLLRGYYTPSMLFREIRQSDHFAWEVFDGKQRIETIQQFTRSLNQPNNKKKHIKVP